MNSLKYTKNLQERVPNLRMFPTHLARERDLELCQLIAKLFVGPSPAAPVWKVSYFGKLL